MGMRLVYQHAILAMTLAVMFMMNPAGLLRRVRRWTQADSPRLTEYSLKISTRDLSS